MTAEQQTRIARDYQAQTEQRRGKRDGVVVTPVEIVDFINRAVADVLAIEFGVTLADDRVKVLDPFTGTGIFPARMLETHPETGRVEAWELDPDAAQVARDNLATVAAEQDAPAPVVRCVDTFAQPTSREDRLIAAVVDRLGGVWDPEKITPELRASAHALAEVGLTEKNTEKGQNYG